MSDGKNDNICPEALWDSDKERAIGVYMFRKILSSDLWDILRADEMNIHG